MAYIGRDHKHAPVVCPYCGHLMTASAGLGHDEAPAPGDARVCIGCAAISVFDERMQLRVPSEHDWEGSDPDTRAKLTAAQAMVRWSNSNG